jgi:hypothetical protein
MEFRKPPHYHVVGTSENQAGDTVEQIEVRLSDLIRTLSELEEKEGDLLVLAEEDMHHGFGPPFAVLKHMEHRKARSAVDTGSNWTEYCDPWECDRAERAVIIKT